jgi:hypothetical protein
MPSRRDARACIATYLMPLGMSDLRATEFDLGTSVDQTEARSPIGRRRFPVTRSPSRGLPRFRSGARAEHLARLQTRRKRNPTFDRPSISSAPLLGGFEVVEIPEAPYKRSADLRKPWICNVLQSWGTRIRS